MDIRDAATFVICVSATNFCSCCIKMAHSPNKLMVKPWFLKCLIIWNISSNLSSLSIWPMSIILSEKGSMYLSFITIFQSPTFGVGLGTTYFSRNECEYWVVSCRFGCRVYSESHFYRPRRCCLRAFHWSNLPRWAHEYSWGHQWGSGSICKCCFSPTPKK